MASLFGNKGAGLSINTGAANSSNLFNSTPSSQPAAGSSLFGGSATASKPAGTLFSSTPASSAPSAGTLFGAGTSSAAPSTSLFGGATTSAPSQAGTLFGGAAASTATSKPGGLFGASTTTTTQPATGSLFGTSLTSQPASQPPSGGLFGMAAPAQPAQPAAGGGLFGGAKPPASLFGINPQPSTQSTGLFGQPAQQQTGLFGQSTAAPAANAGTSMFGNPATQSTSVRPSLNQPQQFAPQQTQRSIFTSSIGQYTAAQTTVPGVRVDASNLRPTTRFGDLHEVLQQELERMDDLILRQQKHADECTQAMPAVANALTYIPSDVSYCERKLDTLQSALEADAAEIDDLKSRSRACADDAKICFRNVSALRTPSQFSIGPGAGPVPAGLLDGDDAATQGQDLHRYVERQIDEMAGKLEKFKRGINEVEGYLKGVEVNTYASLEAAKLRRGEDGGARSADDQIRELANVLREFEGGILGVAGKVGGLRERTQQAMLEESRARGRLGGLY